MPINPLNMTFEFLVVDSTKSGPLLQLLVVTHVLTGKSYCQFNSLFKYVMEIDVNSYVLSPVVLVFSEMYTVFHTPLTTDYAVDTLLIRCRYTIDTLSIPTEI